MKNLCVLIILISFFLSIQAVPGKIVKEFKLNLAHPTGLTFDGKHLWVADHMADVILALDPVTGKTIHSLRSPGFWPAGLAWDGNHLWNVDSKSAKIYQINIQNGRIINTIEAPCANPEGLTWDGKTLWLADAREDKLFKIDLSDGTAVKSFRSPAENIQGLTFDGKYLWCSDRRRDEIYMINPEDGEVIIIISSPGPYARGLTWDGECLWNVDYQTDKLYQLVRRDKDLYSLTNTRHSRVTFLHEVKTLGDGKLHRLDVAFALPMDLPQQKILKMDLNPKETISYNEDQWQQKFAIFKYTKPDQKRPIVSRMVVECKISDIAYYIYPEQCGRRKDIPDDILRRYTMDGSKYCIKDPYIQRLSKEITAGETNLYWQARKIFDYVRKNLEYKLEGGWNIAPVVLKRGTGSCSEYSFAFIALCRAAEIPARFVGSIVVRGDDASLDEVFHRWPEIYLPKYGWIPIDPQGGDKPSPRDRAMNIGHLSNRFLITTQGGGDSRYLGWYYNSYETYENDPLLTVVVENFGEWEPVIE